MEAIALGIIYYVMIHINILCMKLEQRMTITIMMIQLPGNLKAKLDALRKQGKTASRWIRYVREEQFTQASMMGRKGR